MEQMTLGSPIHSPQTTSNQSGFLPGFLLGEFSQQLLPGRIVSPTKLNRQCSTPVSPSRNCFPLHSHNRTTSDKPAGPSGPPISGIYSNIGSALTPNQREHDISYGPPRAAVRSTLNVSQFGGTPSMHTEYDELPLSMCAAESGNSWVTVFGFPPSAAAFILSQFSQFGTILYHTSATGGGNWLHIKYQTRMQAQKALCWSGRILGGSIMVGVTACTDDSVMKSLAEQDASSSFYGPPHFMSTPGGDKIVSIQAPQLPPPPLFDESVNLDSTPLNRSIIRPLTQAYKQASTDNQVLCGLGTPTKNSGFVNRAMEYIFGW